MKRLAGSALLTFMLLSRGVFSYASAPAVIDDNNFMFFANDKHYYENGYLVAEKLYTNNPEYLKPAGMQTASGASGSGFFMNAEN